MTSRTLETLLDFYLVKRAPPLPKRVKKFILKLAPYFIILEVLFLIEIVLATSGGFSLIARWSVDNLPDYIYYGPFGSFMFVYQVSSGMATCKLFTPYLDCSFMYSNTYSPIPREYTNFIIRLVGITLTLIIVIKLFALPKLFERRKSGWNLVFFASLILSILFLVSLNIGAFLLFTLLSFYVLFQIRECYK